MKTLYVEGKSLFHRLTPDVKLSALAVYAVPVFLTRNPLLLTLAMALPLAAYLSLGQPLREAMRPLKPILLTILIVGALQWLFNGHEEAAVTVLRLTTLMLAAATVTATTRITAFMETVTKAAWPLEKLRLARAADIALAVGLVLRFVPEVMARYTAIRDAHKARGIKISAATLIGPLIILTLKDADNIADAIDARGIRRQ
ncbi:energy-coupling factor transporter transmembrane component T family protein [Agrobacterium sp. ES01]|uniref:energy-coupling factor transporter transmembrane component T family protein n=1 Tax=Agrobacterium sp. ES01 TaxID=3420714 RepID=UPI003D10B4EA